MRQFPIITPSDTLDDRVSVTAPASYTHLRAHETKENLVCRLMLDKKNKIGGLKPLQL